MIFRQYTYPDTGCAAYLVGCGGKGICAIVDPQERDLDTYLADAARKKMRIAYAIDTHVHADHRSGGRKLAELSGGKYALHESAQVSFPFERVKDGQKLELGNVVIDVLHTPGHTPDSICLLVTDKTRGPEPWFVLTGDTLFIGSVGRPDLPGRAEENACQLHASIARLLCLPDSLEVYPGHFSGSACGAGMSGKPSSTIAFERKWNKLVNLPRDAFVAMVGDRVPEKPREMLEHLHFNTGTDEVASRAS